MGIDHFLFFVRSTVPFSYHFSVRILCSRVRGIGSAPRQDRGSGVHPLLFEYLSVRRVLAPNTPSHFYSSYPSILATVLLRVFLGGWR